MWLGCGGGAVDAAALSRRDGQDGRMVTVGVVFHPEFEPEALPDYARASEAAGLDELWLWEDCFREGGISTAAIALAVTDRIRVATGVLPMPLRNVALTAMEAATLARVFPGRLVLGVGHGVQDWMGQVGARVDSPLTLMREYVPALRALLASERVSVAGRYVTLDDVALDWAPAVPPPVWAAGEGPRTLELAGELAEGVVLTGGTSAEVAGRALERVRAGSAAAGSTEPVRAAEFFMTVFAGEADATSAARARLERAWDDWKIPEERRGGVAGTAAEVAQQLQPWIALGLSSIVLQPMEDADRAGFVRAAGEVASLLRAASA
jgi:alkanesulfonate monooxygenase SsuD/methylene tetrahydromethanopterin reductase-like flavin-dependent oxidoreductase (luciferase family)